MCRDQEQGDHPRGLCGVVAYEVHDGALSGRWTVNSSKMRGRVGTEEATGGQAGRLEGSYEVEIFVSGAPVYRGKLNIKAVGETFRLRWTGGPESYEGLGLLTAKDRLVASYWRAPTAEPKAASAG